MIRIQTLIASLQKIRIIEGVGPNWVGHYVMNPLYLTDLMTHEHNINKENDENNPSISKAEIEVYGKFTGLYN